MVGKIIATENDWLESRDPFRMLVFLGPEAPERKLRLFACACCRRIWHLFDDDASRKAVEVAEMFADGQIGEAERQAARAAAFEAAMRERDVGDPAIHAARAAVLAVSRGKEFVYCQYTGVGISVGPGKWNEDAYRCPGEVTSLNQWAYHAGTAAFCCGSAAATEATRQRVIELSNRPFHQRLFRHFKIIVGRVGSESIGTTGAPRRENCKQSGEKATHIAVSPVPPAKQGVISPHR